MALVERLNLLTPKASKTRGLLLLVLAMVGIGLRVYYTPDEPREASLVLSLIQLSDWSLPQLGALPFAEKPPLLYWLGATTASLLGSSEAMVRLPNLAYWFLTAWAVSRMAGRVAGDLAQAVSAVVTLTLLQCYLGLIWLATDAPLIAGVACALCGLVELSVWSASGDDDASARPRNARLIAYAWFYGGLLMAFFAKGFAGWLVPGAGLLGVVLFARRAALLTRADFWIGAGVMLVPMALWVVWVALRADGLNELKILFWYNLAGRFSDVAAPAPYHYSQGHPNTPFKYLLELPLYVMPWCGWLFGSVRLQLSTARSQPRDVFMRLWWGCVGLVLLLLSVAHTARGVYIEPLLPLIGVGMSVYVVRSNAVWDQWDVNFWRLNRVCLIALSSLLAAVVALISFAPNHPVSVLWGGVAVVAWGVVLGLLLTGPAMGAAALNRQLWSALLLYGLIAGSLYRCLNPWLSLPLMAERVERVSHHQPLQLWQPDETTQAMASLYWPNALDAAQTPKPQSGTLLVCLTSTHWDVKRYMLELGYASADGSGRVPATHGLPALSPPEGYERFELGCVFERPGGRTLLLWVPAEQGAAVAERCEAK
jgi:4-amino-4-deoxy-L-arabinose transferase-like glycosyltransferase